MEAKLAPSTKSWLGTRWKTLIMKKKIYANSRFLRVCLATFLHHHKFEEEKQLTLKRNSK